MLTPPRKGTLRVCSKGHRYYKTSDCPTCPQCEKEKAPRDGFLALLAAPARRALENRSVSTLKQLSRCTETEIAALHGIGTDALRTLRAALKKNGLTFKHKPQRRKE